jgi:hypothetical protein
LKSIVFKSQAGNTLTWEVDEDCTVICVSGGGHVISSDPSLSGATFFTPSADSVEEKLTLTPELMQNLSYLLKKGQKIFASPLGVSGNVSVLHVIPVGSAETLV